MRIYKMKVKSKPEPSPVLVFIHGGGYFYGNLSKSLLWLTKMVY